MNAKGTERLLRALVWAGGAGLLLACAAVAGLVVWRGAPQMLPTFATENPLITPELYGPLVLFSNTLLTTAAALVIAVPVGVLGAVFLVGYCPRGPVSRALFFLVELLAWVPPVLYGLAGAFLLLPLLWQKTSLLAGGLTLAAMLLPRVLWKTTCILATALPQRRRAALALGAGHKTLVAHVLWPGCRHRVRSAVLRCAAVACGEGAALLLTAGLGTVYVPDLMQNLKSDGATLAGMAYVWAGQPPAPGGAFAAALALLLAALVLCLAAGWARGRCDERLV